MKTKYMLSATLMAVIMFSSCEDLTIRYAQGDELEESSFNSATGITLRSLHAYDSLVYVSITKSQAAVYESIYATSNRPATLTQSIKLSVDSSLVSTYNEANGAEYEVLPEAYYDFEDGKLLTIEVGETYSSTTCLKLYAVNPLNNELTAGSYILPVSAISSSMGESPVTLYYIITVREVYEGDYELYTGDDFFFVFYLNTSEYDPRLITDYKVYKTTSLTSKSYIWYNIVGNILNLTKCTLGYDAGTGEAYINPSSDLRYVIEHYETYILPLQELGIKVCISIQEGNDGVGPCNLTEAQIENVAAQAAALIEDYNLDGINLWDYGTAYGKDGLPAMNTTSYPQLIKSLREAIGEDKLLTLTDYEEPTEYFWDTSATGGIEAGLYLDYAWSGYCDIYEGYQVVDPYHSDWGSGAASLYSREPIASLDPAKYGCINAPWMIGNSNTELVETIEDTQFDIMTWVSLGYRQSNIVLHESMRTNLQDSYEGVWSVSDVLYLLDEEDILYGGDIIYVQDMSLVSTGEYNKWVKDW